MSRRPSRTRTSHLLSPDGGLFAASRALVTSLRFQRSSLLEMTRGPRLTEDRDSLAERFEEHRTHLRAVGYRMLGTLSEADDAVQEAWLRLSRSESSAVENLRGWLTTVVARVCLDMLQSRRRRREDALGVHLPDPIVSRDDVTDPEQEALLAEAIGLALLVVLDTLTPAERLAFV